MSAPNDNPSSLPLQFSARTDIGRVRARNEDALAVRPERGWAVLSDGMGGYRGGDVASRIAVDAALRRLEYESGGGRAGSVEAVSRILANAAIDANAEIQQAAMAAPNLAGMGATLVMAVFLRRQVVSVHVGDSRLYRLRDGLIEQLTRDHTVLQEQIDGGMISVEEARRSRYRGMLSKGLGVASTVDPEVGVHSAEIGDIFLLCSDGLTDMLDEREIADVLRAGGMIDGLSGALIEQANVRGGRDNVSVIVARKIV